ncbi:MAG TPA: HEAT repeat domain-containing protein [Anaerolineales bacterium]|nr:HEAT repeat domain-containing protein [Anaerolineales bacterium]
MEGLDRIDWSKLRHAYGEATDVPNQIRSLLSEDKKMRDDAMYELCGNIIHQGTVYEASAYAVPFLQELLKAPDTPDKVAIAVLLAGMACGNDVYHGILGNDKIMQGITYEEIWRNILAKQGKVLEEEVEKGIQHAEATRLTVEKERHLLYLYLQDEEPFVRAMVAESLAKFPKYSDETLPLLEKALAVESDEDVKESIVNSINDLRDGKHS